MSAVETVGGIVRGETHLIPSNVHGELSKTYGPLYRLDIAQILTDQGLVPSDGSIFCEPHDHNENRRPEDRSDAIYIAHYRLLDKEGTWHEVFVSAIEPGGKSSNHVHHFPVRERYINPKKTEGANLLLNNTDSIPLGDEFVVEPENWHQVHVSKEARKPILLIIDMKNVGSTPQEQLHDHGGVGSDLL